MAPEPPLTPDVMTAEFRRAIELVGTGIQQVVDAFNQIVNHVRQQSLLYSGAVMFWIKDKLDEAREQLANFIGKAQYMVDHSTPVISLITTSFDWLNQVQKPASGVAGRIPLKGDKLVFWKGAAADAYGAKSAFQQGAAGDMATKADFISNWLFTIAKANVDYAKSMCEYISLIAGAMVSALADASTVVGLVEAINKVAEAAGSLVEKALNQLFGIANRLVDLLKNARHATASINNVEKLVGPPAGTWPQAVSVG